MTDTPAESAEAPRTPSEEELQELERALRAASPAPWTTAHEEYGDEWWFGGDHGAGQDTIDGPDGFVAVMDGKEAANAAAIIALRNAAPSLIAEVHRLRARVAELYEALLALFEQFENFEYTTGTEAIQRARAALAKAEDRPIEVTNRPPEK
jgi:hypothetical protein